MKKILSRIVPLALFLPTIALAAGEMDQLGRFIVNIKEFINNILVPFVFAVAFLVFLWGMFKTFILGGHEEEKQKEGKQLMMYAIAGFVVMVSIWGIVNLLTASLNLGNDTIRVPNVPTQRQ